MLNKSLIKSLIRVSFGRHLGPDVQIGPQECSRPEARENDCFNVSRLGLVVRRSAGKRTDPGSTPVSADLSLHNRCFMDTCLVNSPCTINDFALHN